MCGWAHGRTILAERQCAINTARTGRRAPVLELADDDGGGAGLLPVSILETSARHGILLLVNAAF